jgi:flagellar hook-associated protein 2
MASSPITFSGFNDIDFSVVLNSLMAQASVPLTALQSRQSALKTQVKTFDALFSQVSALRSTAAGLDDASTLSGVAGHSSDTNAVSISTSANAHEGQYDVVVTQLARAQVTASATSSPDPDSTIVASGGAITIGGVSVAIAGPVTLQGLADAINETDGIGVNAAVIRTGPSTYRLTLTSTLTGSANSFTVTNALTGGAGIGFVDTDGNGVTGDSAADNAVNAVDALLTVNNVDVTSASNTLSGVVPGVTLTLGKADPATTVHLVVSADSSALEGKLQTFVTTYNNLVKFLDDQRNAAVRGETGNIGRDPVLRQLKSSLRTALLGTYGTGVVSHLAEVGVEFTQQGTLELNERVFSAAVAADPDAVRQLLGGESGAFSAVGTAIEEYASSTGFIDSVKDRLNQQITSMDGQISNMQDRLAIQRSALQQQFIAADQAMSRLKEQMNSLSSLSTTISAF